MDYEALRAKYKPDTIKYLLVAEAPPEPTVEPRFFYATNVTSHDWLFVYTIKALYPQATNLSGPTIKALKSRYLARFQKDGFYLIDAVTEPITQASSSAESERIIRQSAADLIRRIKPLLGHDTKIVLIKATVYNALYAALREAGLPVINTQAIDFPSTGNQRKFITKLQALLAPHNL